MLSTLAVLQSYIPSGRYPTGRGTVTQAISALLAPRRAVLGAGGREPRPAYRAAGSGQAHAGAVTETVTDGLAHTASFAS